MHLAQAAVPCMLLEDATEPSHIIDPAIVSGVIYRNACILSNGSRRDLFQATKLRVSLARYNKEVKADPAFFLGFLDLWASRPLPSVIRRSFKFARYHGVVLPHESAGSIDEKPHRANGSNAFSAFDWLKRADVIQV